MIQIAKIQFNPFGENTYVLYNAAICQAIIVDCGCYNAAEEDRLAAFIDKNNLRPIMVLCTHGHIDHICGALSACKRWDIPFALHSADAEVLSSNIEFAESMGFNVPQVPAIDIDLATTKEIKLGDHTIEIIPTPGHTPGGVSLYVRTQDMLLTGDTLFDGSIGRTDLPGGDYKTLMTSIMGNIIPLNGTTKIFPGHGPDSTLAHQAMYNPFITEVMQGEVNYK